MKIHLRWFLDGCLAALGAVSFYCGIKDAGVVALKATWNVTSLLRFCNVLNIQLGVIDSCKLQNDCPINTIDPPTDEPMEQ